VKRILSILTALTLSVSIAGSALGQDKKPAAFGSLETMSAQTAKTKLAAWLKDVCKADDATLAKLNTIWKDEQRSALDRMADSLALGDPVAAKLMADARDPSAPAPIVVAEVFKNEKRPAFIRANLALVYARALINRRVYEEALDTLRLFNAGDVVEPASYLFNRAVCEHALQRKPEATKTIVRLLEEGSAISPERYKTVATLMLLDMHTWKDKDLGDIARKMDNIERRLDIARGGPETQRQQREVLNRLDELIKKLENANKNKKGKGDGDGPPMPGGDPNGDQCPDGQKPGPGSPGDPNGMPPPSSPAQDSKLPSGQSNGNVDQAKFKKLVSEWGRMPPAEQRRAMQELTQSMNPRHREAIENYFKNLGKK